MACRSSRAWRRPKSWPTVLEGRRASKMSRVELSMKEYSRAFLAALYGLFGSGEVVVEGKRDMWRGLFCWVGSEYGFVHWAYRPLNIRGRYVHVDLSRRYRRLRVLCSPWLRDSMATIWSNCSGVVDVLEFESKRLKHLSRLRDGTFVAQYRRSTISQVTITPIILQVRSRCIPDSKSQCWRRSRKQFVVYRANQRSLNQRESANVVKTRPPPEPRSIYPRLYTLLSSLTIRTHTRRHNVRFYSTGDHNGAARYVHPRHRPPLRCPY